MTTIVSDDIVELVLPSEAFMKGELVVQPKAKHVILEETPDEVVGRLFAFAGRSVPIVFSLFGAGGVNVLVQNGVPAGQVSSNIQVHIIPRREGDGLPLTWNPRPSTEEQLVEAQKKIVGALTTMNSAQEVEKSSQEKEQLAKKDVIQEKKPESSESKEEKKSSLVDYRILHLRKTP